MEAYPIVPQILILVKIISRTIIKKWRKKTSPYINCLGVFKTVKK